jgi:hypothetical protein
MGTAASNVVAVSTRPPVTELFQAVLGAHPKTVTLTSLAAAGEIVGENVIACSLIAKAKIPLTDDIYPRRAHDVVALYDQSLCPTTDEIKLLRGHVECVVESIYVEHLVTSMLEAASAGDDGHNTEVFIKRGPGDWIFRKCTWDHGPWPFHGHEAMSLLALIDHIETVGGEISRRWSSYCEAHPHLRSQR